MDEKLKRANKLAYHYRWHDINTYGFEDKVDFDGQWIVDNIYSKGCIYCGETDWRKLGCDRKNNSKPHTKDNIVPCCKRCNTIKSNKFTVDEMKEIGAVLRRIENKHKDYAMRRGKRLASYNSNGELIKEYECAEQVQEDGYAPRMVRRACQIDGYKYRQYYWRYLD